MKDHTVMCWEKVVCLHCSRSHRVTVIKSRKHVMRTSTERVMRGAHTSTGKEEEDNVRRHRPELWWTGIESVVTTGISQTNPLRRGMRLSMRSECGNASERKKYVNPHLGDRPRHTQRLFAPQNSTPQPHLDVWGRRKNGKESLTIDSSLWFGESGRLSVWWRVRGNKQSQRENQKQKLCSL